MIRFKNVSKVYPGAQLPALSDVTLNITRGEFVFLVGASGSGKSSFLRLILREERATTGLLHVLGQDLTKIRYRKIPVFRRSLGVVFQDFRLLANKTVFDNVAFTLKVIGRSSGFIQNAVPDVLRTVGLENKSDNFPGELSGGEQQRVAIARAVVNKPAILLADEPTGNLDPITSAGIMQIFERINAGGTTVVMATHEASIVNEMQKRVVEVSQGCIVRDEVQGEFGITTKLLVQDKEVSVFLSTKEGAAGSSDASSCANNITGTGRCDTGLRDTHKSDTHNATPRDRALLHDPGLHDTGLQGDVTQGYMTQGVRHSTNLNSANQHSDRQYSDGQGGVDQYGDSGINSQDRLPTSVQSADTERHTGPDNTGQYPIQKIPGQTNAIYNPNSQPNPKNTGTDNTVTGSRVSYRDRHDNIDQNRSVQCQTTQISDDQNRAVPNNVNAPNNTPASRVPGRMPNGHMLDDQDSDRFNTNYSITNNADISDSMLYGDASSDGVLSSTLMHADHIASGRGERGVSIVAAGARPHTPQPCTGQSHTDQPCDLGRLCDPHELPHRFTDERTDKLPTSQLHGLQVTSGSQHPTNQGVHDTGNRGKDTPEHRDGQHRDGHSGADQYRDDQHRSVQYSTDQSGTAHRDGQNRAAQQSARQCGESHSDCHSDGQHSDRQHSNDQSGDGQHSTVEESILEAEKLSIAARTNTHSTDTRHDNTHEHMRKWGEVYLINDDALKLRALPITPKMLVANLPYNIAVPLIMHVLQQFPSIVSATIMLQSEVADRICAKPPSRSAGAVTAKAAWFGHWKKVMKVARHVFYPIPGVDSVIVQFIRDEKSDCEVLREATFSLIEDAFSKRRKMLRQSLRYIPQADFVAAGIDPMLRAENLSVDNFMNLAKRRVYSTGRNLTHLA